MRVPADCGDRRRSRTVAFLTCKWDPEWLMPSTFFVTQSVARTRIPDTAHNVHFEVLRMQQT